jgi:hypothetical protein
MITTDQRREISIENVDTTDVEEIDFVVDDVEQCAAQAQAEVNVVLLSAADGVVVIEVSGYYEDMGAFNRRWED